MGMAEQDSSGTAMDGAKTSVNIVPVEEEERRAANARSALLARLRKQRAVDVGRWTREELYERTK